MTEPHRSELVVALSFGARMLSAVNLNSETKLGTVKIEDKWADAVLSAKLVSPEAATAKVMPQPYFGRRSLTTQTSAKVAGVGMVIKNRHGEVHAKPRLQNRTINIVRQAPLFTDHPVPTAERVGAPLLRTTPSAASVAATPPC